MRRLLGSGLVAVLVLVLAAGAMAIFAGSDNSGPVVATADSTVSADIEARRADQGRRIEQGRLDGRLRGVAYLALLSEQQKLQVAQRRAEAQGFPPQLLSQLLADLDRASAHIDQRLGKK